MEAVGIILGGAVLAVAVIGGFCARKSEKRIWNKGVCSFCQRGFWKSFDMDSSGARGYNCSNCDSYCWISYNVDK